MNNRDSQRLDRRGFLKLGVGAGAAIGVSLGKAFAQERPAWEARPANPASVRPVSIDMHTHWAPERYTQAQVEMGRPAPANPFPLDFDLDKRVKWMNEHGVQMHVLTLSGGMPWQWATPEQGVRLAQIVNDAAVEAHTAHPDRFVAGIAMPVKDPQMALKELNRVAGKPGMRAVHLPNSMEQRDYLFEPAFEPILARCQELGYPLLFHPLDGEANFYSQRLVGPPSVTNWLGFTFEHATTALKFITTGTLDKFPRLEIVLPHGGGAFPFIFARVEHGFYHMGSAQLKTDRPFRDYLRRFHYDTITHSPQLLRFLIDLVGVDRVMLGSDYCFDMGYERPREIIDALKLKPADQDSIYAGNAARVLGV